MDPALVDHVLRGVDLRCQERFTAKDRQILDLKG